MGSFSDTPALLSTGDVYPYRFVRVETTAGSPATIIDNKGEQVTSAADNVVGVADGSTKSFSSSLHAAEGDPITLQGGDVVLVECGGAVVRGGRVQADSDGKAISAVVTAGPLFRYQGYVALETGATGQIIRIYRNGGMVYYPTAL
jgi:hypothetical protein